MNELIILIEETVSALMRYDMEVYATEAQQIVDDMMALLPAIINCYSDPKMSDVKEDALYWPGQMERIIKALESHDRFEAVDVLYNETYPNLIELRDMLKERGLG
jgi:hypothetical protein